MTEHTADLRHDPGYSRPFEVTHHRDIPVLREVEEYGKSRIVLMQRVANIRHYPAQREIVARWDGDELVFEYKDTPAEAWGENHWEKAR